MIRVFIIALREVRSYLQDRADLAFSLILPVAIFALMYGAFGGQSLFNGTAYVVNEDPGGIYSQRLIECLTQIMHEALARPFRMPGNGCNSHLWGSERMVSTRPGRF